MRGCAPIEHVCWHLGCCLCCIAPLRGRTRHNRRGDDTMLGTIRTKVAKAMSGRAGTDDPFELLQEDHRGVERLFKEIQDATPARRRALFSEIARQLGNHTVLEERLLYPPL